MSFQPVPAQFAGQTITDAQTVTWAKQAGFTGNDLQIAVAVSFTENGSRKVDSIHTNSDGSHDLGEWQINDKAHPDLLQQFPEWWSVQNADMAHSVWQSSGWGAWTTFADGDYKANMNRAAVAIANEGLAPTNEVQGKVDTTNILTQIGNSVAAIAQDVFKAGAWMAKPENWMRIALVAVGGIVVIGGVLSASKNQISGVVGALPTPVGQAAKAVAKGTK